MEKQNLNQRHLEMKIGSVDYIVNMEEAENAKDIPATVILIIMQKLVKEEKSEQLATSSG